MSQSVITPMTEAGRHSDRRFAVGFVLFTVVAMMLTSCAPMTMSMAIVLLFAGPHNYVEARYFLTRFPARVGRLRIFFGTSMAGILALTVSYPLLFRLPEIMGWGSQSLIWLVGGWNTVLILWITVLVSMRSRQAPRRNWDYAWPAGIAVAGVSWLHPFSLSLLLVYVHPLMGLWILDRELAEKRPDWHQTWRRCLIAIPALLFLAWIAGPNSRENWITVSPVVTTQITRHSGAPWFPAALGSRLVMTHTFLELLHYGVWLIAVPLASGRVFSATFRKIPLMKRPGRLRHLVPLGMLGLAGIVVLLWIGFAADYSTTRDIYFTVATAHVLAEIPFLLRML